MQTLDIAQTQQPKQLPLKWAGSKRNHLRLKELFEPYRDQTYVAPFCGGFGDPFLLQPDRAVLGDANPYLAEGRGSVKEIIAIKGIHKWI